MAHTHSEMTDAMSLAYAVTFRLSSLYLKSVTQGPCPVAVASASRVSISVPDRTWFCAPTCPAAQGGPGCPTQGALPQDAVLKWCVTVSSIEVADLGCEPTDTEANCIPS